MQIVRRRDLARLVIGVDPAVTSGENSDETGIVVAARGVDGFGYVLQDLSCKASPDTWAKIVVKAYHEYAADRVVCEVNQGGDLLERLLRTVDKTISYKGVHARKGKYTRAEPIAALYEQGRVFHVGTMIELESQMCEYTPDNFTGSPDRVDALVWGLTDLMLGDAASFGTVDWKSPATAFGAPAKVASGNGFSVWTGVDDD